MSDDKSNKERRKVLKGAVIGGSAVGAGVAAPKKWVKPVMGSVVLPVHASATKKALSATALRSSKYDYS